jgi:hypothetical protein
VDGPARLDVRLGGKESRLVGKLATVEGGRSRAAEGRGDLADGQLGQEAVGEAAYEQRQPGRLGHEDLGQRRPQASTAGNLDHEVVNQSFRSVREEIRRTHARLVNGDRYLDALPQLPHQVHTVGGQGLLEHIHAGRGEAGRRLPRLVEPVTLVGVSPHERLGPRRLANGAGDLHIHPRVHGGLEVEMPEPSLPRGGNLFPDRRGVMPRQGVTKLYGGPFLAAAEEGSQGHPRRPGAEVVDRQVKGGFGDGLPGTRPAANGSLHSAVQPPPVSDGQPEQRGRKVVADGRLDRL